MKRLLGILLFLAAEVVPLLASVGIGVFGTVWQVSGDVAWLVWTIVAAIVAVMTPVLTRWNRYARFVHWTLSSGRRAEALKHTLESLLQRALVAVDRNNNRFRASVYYFHQGRFHMIARYSSNPQLVVRGRLSYARDQGVIGRVWLEEFAIAMMPKDPEKWVQNAVQNYGFSESDARSISMKARKLGGFTVRDSGKCVGVIMLETFDTPDLSEKVILEFQKEIEQTPLGEIVAKSAALFPAVEAYERTTKQVKTKPMVEDDWVEVKR